MLTAVVAATCFPTASANDLAGSPFVVTAIDAESRRPVPMVELTTVHGVKFVTDNLGVAAIEAPELDGMEVFLHVFSHGYEVPKDGFGFRGLRVRVESGGAETTEVSRRNLAERVGRLTGAGRYAESLAAGKPIPPDSLVPAASISGCDSVMTAVFGGEMIWVWGDTNRLSYPLGIFNSLGARTPVPAADGPEPDAAIPFEYFVGEDDQPRGVAPIPGDGPTWLTGVATLPDRTGKERLVTTYQKIRPPLDVYEHGLAEWDPEANEFRKLKEIPLGQIVPEGHTLVHTDDDGIARIYFGDPYPFLRMPATFEAWGNPESWEGFACPNAEGAGKPEWVQGARPLTQQRQERLIERGDIAEAEAWIDLRDAKTGRTVEAHRGSVAWNEFRRRWVMITTEQGGESSYLGEVWYAEADAPEGPWRDAVKVVTHNHYSFYNPLHHPQLDREGGRIIFFEGTYTAMFSAAKTPTPRYDYNQILYRLDLEKAAEALGGGGKQ